LSVTCGRSLVFSGYSVSSTHKTDRHDITEILLKVALNTITLYITRVIYACGNPFYRKYPIIVPHFTLSQHLSSPPVFISRARITRSLILRVVLYRSLFVLLSFFFSVLLRITDSDYHHGIVKLFIPIWFIETRSYHK